MTGLALTGRTVAYRLAPTLVVEVVITLGIGVILVALIAGLPWFAELTSPLHPIGPGAPDLQRGSIA
ncbi:MAG TPA: hypothetical protein VF365_10645 [Candidatus Limnocylindria bacterium]